MEHEKLDHELLDEIRKTGFRFAQASRGQKGRTPVKGEQAFLFVLAKNGKTKAGDFPKLLHAGTGRVANIAKSLSKKGYITKEQDGNDHRITYFSLTEKGKERISEIEKRATMFLQERLNRWGKKKIEDYLKRTNERIDVFKERSTNHVQIDKVS